ncbi:eCIS core domain-containing protein [Solirubrobacter soli]|uniref:eCIS core domain-containing protein n=1 Tax=Solirubrobacter soli TaxID=363832 RepID=UPI0004116EEC|nr:DUF4157 domain-containing protein [Solirubrobacter soli]
MTFAHAAAYDDTLPLTHSERAELPLAAPALIALQRTAGNQAASRALGRSEAFAQATSGQPVEVPRRRAMEAAFGTGFGDVRAYLGGPAAEAGLGALGASAAARGTQIAFRDASPTDELVAHELAHVVQQRRGAEGVACDTGPSTDAERAARAAGAAVAAGRPVGDVGVAAAGGIQLAEATTTGGIWETKSYALLPHDPASNLFGAAITLHFEPTHPVVSERIALVQTVRTLKSTEQDPAVATPHFVSTTNAALALPEMSSHPGRAIDQPSQYSTDTSPIYASSGEDATTLEESEATKKGNQHGFRRAKQRPDEEDFVQRAILTDKPTFRRQFDEQEWEKTFEVTALVLEGALANKYLGSVAWGFRCEGGVVTLDPLTVVRQGPPSAEFMDAAKQWNRSTVNGEETVDLPIESSDLGSLSTAELIRRLTAARADADATLLSDMAGKQFDVLAIERELKARNVAYEP